MPDWNADSLLCLATCGQREEETFKEEEVSSWCYMPSQPVRSPQGGTRRGRRRRNSVVAAVAVVSFLSFVLSFFRFFFLVCLFIVV